MQLRQLHDTLRSQQAATAEARMHAHDLLAASRGAWAAPLRAGWHAPWPPFWAPNPSQLPAGVPLGAAAAWSAPPDATRRGAARGGALAGALAGAYAPRPPSPLAAAGAVEGAELLGGESALERLSAWESNKEALQASLERQSGLLERLQARSPTDLPPTCPVSAVSALTPPPLPPPLISP